jgi:L-alanine-DL-glutamate epimerase-like enolase superfamily enzyme
MLSIEGDRVVKITRVEPFHVEWGANKSAWVCIWTDAGLHGLGEASPIVHGNTSLEIIASAFAPLLIDADPLAHRALQDRLFHHHIKLGPEGAYAAALAAIDICSAALGAPSYRFMPRLRTTASVVSMRRAAW